ncbi:MAG: HAMP domain-containing sensor histidine kinase [Terracoccus sp.]
MSALIAGLPTNDASSSIVRVSGRWFGALPSRGPSAIPPGLFEAVGSSTVATQRISVDGTLYLAVGAPLRQPGDLVLELFSLDDLDRTLTSMAVVLAIAAALTTGLGGGLGRWASGLALAPLEDLTAVVAAVAAGHLDARLEQDGDAHLDPLARAFNATLGELAHRARVDSRFAVDVGHELRTPLTTMLNSMEVITHRRSRLPESVREAVDLLADDLGRFRVLVVDRLEISRHDAGEGLVLEPVDLGELTRWCADRLVGRPITEVTAHPGDLVVVADKRRLERVVSNLVVNAQVRGRGCTAVRVLRSGAFIRIEVEDAGPGIDMSDRSRVFDRFARGVRRTPLPRSQALGLGLVIVQRHVAAHQGLVLVEEGIGGGARFVVELPVH